MQMNWDQILKGAKLKQTDVLKIQQMYPLSFYSKVTISPAQGSWREQYLLSMKCKKQLYYEAESRKVS